jgi:hypothetical protein
MTAALCFLAGCAARTADQQIQHDDAHYSSALRSYLSDLKPGVSRKEVEDYFRARSISFGRGMTITLIDHRLLSICPTRTLLGFAKRRAPGRAARLMSISFSSSQGTDPTAVSATSKPMKKTLWKVSIYRKSTIAFRTSEIRAKPDVR